MVEMTRELAWGFADIAAHSRLGSNELRVGARGYESDNETADDPVKTAAERSIDIRTSRRLRYLDFSIFVTVYWPLTCSASNLILLPALTEVSIAGS